MSNEDKKSAEGYGTTGHSWDGIEEWNNPLPRWWLWTFYITIIWAIGYSIAYPAWPMISHATAGVLGYSTRGEVEEDIAAFDAANAGIEAELATADLTKISATPELQSYAQNAGAAVFRTRCAQCHGAGAAGAVGYPNLNDDDWLWGGDIESIVYTVRNGIRNETADARYSEMPAFGDILEPAEIDDLTQYVLSLSGLDHDAAMAAQGATLFLDNCAACHGDSAIGDRDLGAPNLTDPIWLYVDANNVTPETVAASVKQTITAARFGVMPAWGGQLSDAEINAVATWVHSRGGGE